MNLSEIKALLLTVTPDTFHYFAYKKPDKYIVWAEDTEASSGHGDNKKTNQVIQGTIDYFTKTEFDTNVDLIQEKLTQAEIAYKLSSIQYEEETRYIHYEWIFEVVNDG